jgi:hypothetical protein
MSAVTTGGTARFTIPTTGHTGRHIVEVLHSDFNSLYRNIEIFMQATGEPGWHFIDLYPGIYKGRETRPNNYRLPQLTYADDHPGEDLPRFRFAFEVARDATDPAQ